jgi:hypothetical protein
MAIPAKLETLNDERTQRNKVFQARALLQRVRETITEVNAEIQTIADSGSFDTVDTEIKQALITTWDVVKAAKAGFEDTDIAKFLDWRP